jgi:hypothetical protein
MHGFIPPNLPALDLGRARDSGAKEKRAMLMCHRRASLQGGC